MTVRSALALSLLLLACACAADVEVREAAETVDVTSLTESRITLALRLPADYARSKLDDASLPQLCASRFPSATSCAARSSASGDEATVTFSLTERPVLLLEGFSRSGSEASIAINLAYVPRQFSVTSGYAVRKRRVELLLPTHRTVIDDVGNVRFNTTFALKWRGDVLDLRLPTDAVTAGERVAIPAPGGSLCGAVLTGTDGKLLSQALSIGCGRFGLGTSGDLPPGSYDLHVFSITGLAVRLVRRALRVERSPLPFRAWADRELVYLGAAFTVRTSSQSPLDGCRIRLVDPLGSAVDSVAVRSCDSVPIGTSPAWTPGNYLVTVTATSGQRSGNSSFPIELRGMGYSEAETRTDKDSYTAGESIAAYTKADGDLCRLELVDGDHVRVVQQEVPGCGRSDLPIDEGVAAGDYVLTTAVYKDGKLKAVSSTGIEVAAWRPAVATSRSDLCVGGSFPIDRYLLPCIAEGASCLPASHAVPLCLCFSEDEAVGVCSFGQRCQRAGCLDSPLAASPFVVVYERGECLAKHGIQTLSCIEAGEICRGNCVCLDPSAQPTSSCITGDVCTASGCQPMVLEFELASVSSDHARADELARGLAVTWTGPIRFRGNLLDGTKQGQVAAKGRLGGLDSSSNEVAYLSPEKGWRVTTSFSGSLEPGEADAFLVVAFGGETHVIRRPFAVWFPQGQGELDLVIEAVSPAKVSLPKLEFGTSVKVSATVRDRSGKDVGYLPQEAASLSIGNLKAMTTAPSYEPLSGLWSFVGTFRSPILPKGNFVTLAVDHLGRKGSAWTGFMVLERTPLAVKLTRVEPGTSDQPLFVLLATLGFDMDLYLQVESPVQLDRSNFRVSIGAADVSKSIAYVTTTSSGTRVHLSDVRLCPDPPAPNSRVRVMAAVEAGGDSSEDSAVILVQGNPGNWKNAQEAQC